MTRYEKTLSKVSPTFYKEIQYFNYFENSRSIIDLIFSYLKHINLPPSNFLDITAKNIYYYCIIWFDYSRPITSRTTSGMTIRLTTNDKEPIYYNPATLSEFILDMVINKFSFENEIPIPGDYTYTMDFKKVFIALVGKEMYDALRANIK